jgi:hypothetical protein
VMKTAAAIITTTPIDRVLKNAIWRYCSKFSFLFGKNTLLSFLQVVQLLPLPMEIAVVQKHGE